MNSRRDPDRLIHDFVLEGAERLHDQVYDAVRAEIERRPQRVVIGPWRMPTLNKLVPIGLGAVAVVAVLAFGSRLFGSPSNTVGGPAAGPTPTPTPSVAAPSPSSDGSLPVGPFTIVDNGSPDSPLEITVTIPSPGWTSIPDFGGLIKGEDGDPPESAMLAWSWPVGTGFSVYGDPCHWQSTTPDTPITTVDDFAAALAAQASRDASDPVDVTVDSHAGKQITLHVPGDTSNRSEAFADCDLDTFATYGEFGLSEPNRFQQGPGQIDELWILDVDGAFAIIDAMYRPDTPTALVEEMRAVAESASFE
jgi:hypothetical protein